jgi:ribosomal protein S18 acetylase RimI-like enzyme
MLIFESLNEAAERGELILVDGGLCHWHLRRDGQVTIREIIVLPAYRRRGIATMMLNRLKCVVGTTSIFAKCPVELPANAWYQAQGFEHEGIEITKSGRELKLWRLSLS